MEEQTTRTAGTAASWRASPRGVDTPAQASPSIILAVQQVTKASGGRALMSIKAQTPVELSRSTDSSKRGEPTAKYLELVERPSPVRPTHHIVLAIGSKAQTRSKDARGVRRGELDGIKSTYSGISNLDEFLELCEAFSSGKLKTTELEDLFLRGKISTSVTTVKRHVYGLRDPKKPEEWKISPGAWKSMTKESLSASKLLKIDDTMILGLEAEEFMVHFLVRCHLRKKGFTDIEIKMWARAQVR